VTVGQLRYDDHLDRFVGERFSIDADAFADALDELVEGGMPEEEAHLFLLQDEEWSPDMEGVAALPSWPLCLPCRLPLWPTQSRFCDVVCEASFYAAAYS